jgi:cell division protein FtsQ
MRHGELTRTAPRLAVFDAALWIFTGLLALIASILAIDWLLRPTTFPVQAVHLEGEFKRVSQAELEGAVMDTVRGNFLRVDLGAVKEKVEALPWVQSASVRRAWPRNVHVQFTEQYLLARWNGDAWVNQALEAVQVAGADLPQQLARLEGPDGTQAQVYERYQTLHNLLAASDLGLARLTLTPRRTWRLELDNGIALVLDRDDVEQKVARFARAWPSLAHNQAAIAQVDLRYTNGFAVLWKAGRASTGATGEG